MLLLSIPKSTQKIFWSCKPSTLDSQKHKEYIVHQVLQHGDLEDYRWLKEQYSRQEIKDIFISKPRPTYQSQTFNFIKNFLLKISQSLPKERYVKSSL
ncbi:MAG: hypothetical protein COZ34_00315 [Candidatus Pacebacteria bacterium CG_4_10_14_3_um_filter_34_15]|nr:hypothetical protein [Candidatus Paceibacterota bacterium]NCS86350.1 hypothetical protein [Candidatus Paceibacterota bacterium]PIQ81347.1 MAG: hypothetical protein COV78_00705 [Candidatus Pacebacteria bacterium CG11_big_fil_rev_8_21_14_0_20_34_55]PIX82004.1 MAG: hypothetical protein COZ34_00315 [Candidatus Pacebacteria bacterium CG_4_10_14_3_um_filter_34_15]